MLGFQGNSDSKESSCSVGDLGLILGLGRSPGEVLGIPLHYSWPENSMDRRAWWTKSMGSQRVRHAWVTNTHTHTHTHTHTYALIINHTNAGQEESVCVSICPIKVACVIYRNSGVRHIIEWNKASAQWNLHCQGQIKRQILINNMLDGSECCGE